MGKYRITPSEFQEAYEFWFEDEAIPENIMVLFLQNIGVEIAASRLG